jgi:hypothetical protein
MIIDKKRKGIRENKMDWSQVFTIIGANIALFFWLRTEANADRRQMQSEVSADRRDLLQLIREIKDELKDFHGRMCSIEERNKSK